MSDEQDILAANTAFYTAFRAGDLEAMRSLWAEDGVSCIHPGWPALIGRTPVLNSWRQILGSPERPRIECQGITVIVTGDDGRVLCLEIVGSVALAATNQFRRIDGTWRMVHHQASSVARVEPDAPPTPGPTSRRLH